MMKHSTKSTPGLPKTQNGQYVFIMLIDAYQYWFVMKCREVLQRFMKNNLRTTTMICRCYYLPLSCYSYG